MASDYAEIWSPISRIYDPIVNGSIDGTDVEPHDHGIVRALNSTYRPNAKVTGDPHCTIFIARLNHATDEIHLKQIFSKYGQIKQLRLVRDIVTGCSKGYAFIEYYDSSIVDRVYQEANRMTIDDREILVDYTCARVMPGWIPRRLGGGLGGRKESGQLRFGCRDRPFRKPIYLSSEDYQTGMNHSRMHGRYGRDTDTRAGYTSRSRQSLDANDRNNDRSARDRDGGLRQSSPDSSDEDMRTRRRRRNETRDISQSYQDKQIKRERDADIKLSSHVPQTNVGNREEKRTNNRQSTEVKQEVE